MLNRFYMQGRWLFYIYFVNVCTVYILFNCKNHSQTCGDNFHDSVPYDFFDMASKEGVGSHKAADISSFLCRLYETCLCSERGIMFSIGSCFHLFVWFGPVWVSLNCWSQWCLLCHCVIMNVGTLQPHAVSSFMTSLGNFACTKSVL